MEIIENIFRFSPSGTKISVRMEYHLIYVMQILSSVFLKEFKICSFRNNGHIFVFIDLNVIIVTSDILEMNDLVTVSETSDAKKARRTSLRASSMLS